MPMRLVSKEYIEEVVKKEYTGKNAQEIAKSYGYSERHIRRLIKETREKKVTSNIEFPR